MLQPLGHWTGKIYAPDQILFNKVSTVYVLYFLSTANIVKATWTIDKSKLQRPALCVKEQKDCPWSNANMCGRIQLPRLHVKKVLGVNWIIMDSSTNSGLADTGADL